MFPCLMQTDLDTRIKGDKTMKLIIILVVALAMFTAGCSDTSNKNNIEPQASEVAKDSEERAKELMRLDYTPMTEEEKYKY